MGLDDEVEDDNLGPSINKLDAGEIFSTSWTIYRKNIGLLLGTFAPVIISGLIPWLLCIFLLFLPDYLGFHDSLRFACFLLLLLLGVVLLVCQGYLMAGATTVVLKVVRGQETEIAEMFRAGRQHILPMVICLWLFSIMFNIGLNACFVPAIVVSVAFFPWRQILVDRSLTGVRALVQATDLTKGRWADLCVIALGKFLISIVGFAIFGVGFFLTRPLMEVVSAVTYMKLSGQEIVVKETAVSVVEGGSTPFGKEP